MSLYRSPYEAYPFLCDAGEDLRCDFELLTDEMASRTGLLRAQVKDEALKAELLWVCELIYHMNPTLRTRLTVTEEECARLLELASGRDGLTHDEECQYLTRVGLCAADYIDREVDASLSGGEVKRIEIATILARGSQLMIFDEPEAGIDLWSFARLTETFEQIHTAGTATMIIISHQERIISLADEVIVVGDGQLRHRGSPKDILPQILSDTLSGCPVLTKEGVLR